jgi:hypothetical protein
MPTDRTRNLAIRDALLAAYEGDGVFGEGREVVGKMPASLTPASDEHLAYLTLVLTISGGRDAVELWEAARQTFEADPELFDPRFLAYVKKPQDLLPRLKPLTRKRGDATTWQRTGKAIVMRGQGSVKAILEKHEWDAEQLLTMLAENKATFPVWSGEQTAPRWVWVMENAGIQPLTNTHHLQVPLSNTGQQTLSNLNINGEKVSAQMFAPLEALGMRGCRQKEDDHPLCPVANQCPVATFCQFGTTQKT